MKAHAGVKVCIESFSLHFALNGGEQLNSNCDRYTPGKSGLYIVKYEAVWFSESVWMLRKGDNLQKSTCLPSTQLYCY